MPELTGLEPCCGPCHELVIGKGEPHWTPEQHPCFRAGFGEGSWMARPQKPCVCRCGERMRGEDE